MILPISYFCFHSGVALHGLSWVYGGGSAHTVVEWPTQVIKGNPGYVLKGFRRHGDPGQCLHGRSEGTDASLGGIHKQR